MAKKKSADKNSTANIGFEAKLWLAANIDSDLEDRDEYLAENVFWVPKVARWSVLQAGAKQPTVGKTIDDAMAAIEKDNSSLKGVLPKDYGRASLDKQRLGVLVDRTHRELSDDELPFDERMEQLTDKLKGQFSESASLGFTGKESS